MTGTTLLINLIRTLRSAIGSFFTGAHRTPRDFNVHTEDSQNTSHVSASHPRKIKRQRERGWCGDPFRAWRRFANFGITDDSMPRKTRLFPRPKFNRGHSSEISRDYRRKRALSNRLSFAGTSIGIPTSPLPPPLIHRFQLKASRGSYIRCFFAFAVSRVSLESGRELYTRDDSCLRSFTHNAALHDSKGRDEYKCKKKKKKIYINERNNKWN